MRLSLRAATEADTVRGRLGLIEALPEEAFRYALQPASYAAHFYRVVARGARRMYVHQMFFGE